VPTVLKHGRQITSPASLMPTSSKYVLEVEDLKKSFAGKPVLEGIGFRLLRSRVGCFLGPSGCGKSTLLRIVAGLENPDGGRIRSHIRRYAFIFQEPRLLPWLSAEDNIIFALRGQDLSEEERRRRAREALRTVRLEAFYKQFPFELSGGQRQRVAIARALATEPDLLLMDEPLASLDFPLRLALLEEMATGVFADGRSALYVTHDTREAVLICDDIYLLGFGPAKILAQYEVPVPRKKRSAEDPSLYALSNELTRQLKAIAERYGL